MDIPYLSLQKVTQMHLTEIETAVKGVIESGWYLKGQATKRFETHYARYVGSRHCVGCGNGLDALTLIFRAYKEMGVLRDGDEVLVPANAYIASILSLTENHLKPVLIEPRLDDLQIDAALISQAITPRSRAILLVHMYGRCSWTPSIQAICDHYKLKVIEDNAQAAGCRAPDGDKSGQCTGTLGDAAAHSFYPGKNLGALGDAGAVTTDDDELADVVRALGNYGSSRKYVFDYKGKNSRMDECQAAVLDVKLPYLDGENQRRREIADYYYQNIRKDIVSMPGLAAWKSRQGHDLACNYHIFPVLCSERDELQTYLTANGIGTMIHYPIPPHQQTCYPEWNRLSLPITEKIHREELSLPCNQTMTQEEVEEVVRKVNAFKL